MENIKTCENVGVLKNLKLRPRDDPVNEEDDDTSSSSLLLLMEQEEERASSSLVAVEEAIAVANGEALAEFEARVKKEEEEMKRKREEETTRERLTKEASMSRLDTLLTRALTYINFLTTPDEEQDATIIAAAGDTRKKKNKVEPTQQPSNMTGGRLKPYQIAGFEWLTNLWKNGISGILSDEMGLGKTVQTIALLSHLHCMKVYDWRIVVAPLSTLPNWLAECKRWTPSMPVVLYHGSREERKHLLKEMMGKTGANIPVVLTSYEIVQRDRAELGRLCSWSFLIVDEGHRLKNRDCRLIRELNKLMKSKNNTDGVSRLLLTGTPLQNNLSELWSLLNFLLPEVFDDLEFFKSVFEFDPNDPQDTLLAKNREESVISKLHRILQPLMLRRLKNQVEKELPPKKEIVLYCAMTDSQKDLYQIVKNGGLSQFAKDVSEQQKGVGGEDLSKKSMMNLLMQLRKVSNHPYLIFDPTNNSGNEEASSSTGEDLVTFSGKMLVLDTLLKSFRKKKHKVLIFSQFTTMLDIIDDYLRFLRPDYGYVRLDGNTSLQDRQHLMKRFNDSANEEDLFVFLLSTRAGGVGINLMAADTVILFDSDWNPHQDSQAQDRVHRIGQPKPVVVYRLISSGSVELKILASANSKRKLERVICGQKSNLGATIFQGKNEQQQGGGGGGDEFSLTAPTTTTTAAVLTEDELKTLLNDEFTGHLAELGSISLDGVTQLTDREFVFSSQFQAKGVGYEVAQFKVSSIVGAINE